MQRIALTVFVIDVALTVFSESVGRNVVAQGQRDADISLWPHDNETPVIDFQLILLLDVLVHSIRERHWQSLEMLAYFVFMLDFPTAACFSSTVWSVLKIIGICGDFNNMDLIECILVLTRLISHTKRFVFVCRHVTINFWTKC